MNIGLFSDTFFPQINGVATSIQLLEKELTALGHNVYIFTTTDPGATPKSNVFRMPSMPFVFLPTHRVGLLYPPQVLLKIRKLKLDIVHTHSEFSLGIFGKVVSEFIGAPLVHTYHTMWEDYVHYVARGHLITPKMARQFSRLFCNRARVVVAPTEKAQQSLMSYGVERPIRIIPTGIDFEPFSPSAYLPKDIQDLRKSLGILPNDKIILSLGRVAKEKSMDVAIRSMPEILATLPHVKLVIVGDGPARADLQSLAADLGLDKNVIFTGARPWAEIGKYYQIGDIFVSASTTETQGLTYCEAMAAGLLLAAKHDQSIADLVRHGETGFTFHKDEELAALIIDMLQNPDKMGAVAANALNSIANLSSKQFGANIAQLYSEVASAYPKPDAPRTVRLKMRR